jgi:hypothetical protein
MPFVLDPEKWSQIESLPLPSGVGDEKHGLCAVARIVYACTGKVSDMADATCIAPTLRAYLIKLNDSLPEELRARLGSREIADRVLAADTSREAERRRAFLCADAAVRTFAVLALRSVNLDEPADELAALSPVTDEATANAAANSAARAADAAAYYADVDAAYYYAANANSAAADAAYASANAAAYAYGDADAAGSANSASAASAFAAAAAAADVAWEAAFELLDTLLTVKETPDAFHA